MVSRLKGLIPAPLLNDGNVAVEATGAVMLGFGVVKGECNACVVSKSAGSALDLIIRSRSSVVSRFSFARLLSTSASFEARRFENAHLFWNQT